MKEETEATTTEARLAEIKAVFDKYWVATDGGYDELAWLIAEIERLRAALRYIERPTMGLPSGADAEDFARGHATDPNVRLALVTCIAIAKRTLAAAVAAGSEQ
jgi:hypothetical protein